MIVKNQILRDRIFYWLATLSIVSLPFPEYSINSIAMIVLVAYWLVYNPISEKMELLHQNRIPLIALSSLFWIPLLGSLYAADISHSFRDIQLKLPFLIFPLVFLTVRLKSCRDFILDCFVLAVLAASGLALAKLSYFSAQNLGDYTFYNRFSKFLNKHTTYFSLYIVVSLLWLLWLASHKKGKKLPLLLGALVLVYVFYLLSVRNSVIALTVGGIVITLFVLKGWKRWAILIAIPIVAATFFATPHFKKRFEPSMTEVGQMSDFEFRKYHWNAVLETISHNNFLIGAGTRGDRQFLYDKYREYNLTAAYELQYNAHNQFLEMFLDFGLLGFLAFLGLLLYLLWFFVKKRDYLALSMLSVCIVFMLTESLLQRHNAIVLFAFFMALFVSLGTNSEKEALL